MVKDLCFPSPTENKARMSTFIKYITGSSSQCDKIRNRSSIYRSKGKKNCPNLR